MPTTRKHNPRRTLQGKFKNINFNIDFLLYSVPRNVTRIQAQQFKEIIVEKFSHQTHLDSNGSHAEYALKHSVFGFSPTFTPIIE